MAILITGGSGFIGSQLVKKLAEKEDVICFSRKSPDLEVTYVSGTFDNLDDLSKLDNYKITSLIHLAAVTGGCSEEDGLSVNVLGSSRLIRYLTIQHGCRKFVIASSIATVGCLSDEFLPLQFPIPDNHPCLATDAYGLSKYLAEELSKYFTRVFPDAEFTHLRLGAICPNETWSPEPVGLDTELTFPITTLTRVLDSDVVDAFIKALLRPLTPGFHVYNVIGPDAACDIPIVEKLYSLYGKETMDKYDLSFYNQPGNAYKPLFAIKKIKDELGHESLQTTIPKKRQK